MNRYGPDSLNSWIIAASCCFINMMMYGMARLSGVLFVASVTKFNVGREKASFPYTFANFMRNTSGPLVGYLGYKFGVRPVTTFGAVLGALGAGLCYFAQSIDMVTFLWGAVFGLGFGLGNILLPVAINQYFDKYRSTASGISFSGACLGSFILPPIVEILLNKYGLSGTFLFLSAFILNCAPAALLLRKPSFEIITSKPCDEDQGERQSIVSGKKVKLYTVENDHQTRDKNTAVTITANKDVQGGFSALTYEERIKRLSTQTLLSNYSIRMSTSEPLDADQILGNNKGRRQIDPKVLEEDISSVSSQNTDKDKDEVFENRLRSSSVEYEKKVVLDNKTRALSIGNRAHIAEKEIYRGFTNYGFQKDTAQEVAEDQASSSISTIKVLKTNYKPFVRNDESFSNASYQRNSDSFKRLADHIKDPSGHNKDLHKSIDWSDTVNVEIKDGKADKKCVPTKKDSSTLGAFSVIYDPMFILIAITNGIYCFTFVCMITVIVDFARDLQIGTSNEKYVLMLLSIGDLIGRLGLGWVTDRGYMTTTAFTAFCFACQGLFTAAIAWSVGFASLVILVTLYGMSEAGLIFIFPIIIAQYIEKDKQTVAIPSSNFLSGPLCLAVSPLIGYFRDEIGAYDWIFYGIGILSAICCVSWMIVPLIIKRYRKCCK